MQLGNGYDLYRTDINNHFVPILKIFDLIF